MLVTATRDAPSCWLAGYARSAAARQNPPCRCDLQAQQQVLARAADAHPATMVERWLSTGECLTEAQAAAIAFDDVPLDEPPCATHSAARHALVGARGLEADPRHRLLHAAVRAEARDHKRLEQLCRYITRPGAGGRTGLGLRRRAGGAQAQVPVARRLYALGDEPARVHAAGGAPLPRRRRRPLLHPTGTRGAQIKRQLCGDQFTAPYVRGGSATADRGRRLSGRSTWGSAFRR